MQFAKAASGGVVKNLNSDKVSNAQFSAPPIEEQQRTVERLDVLLPLENAEKLLKPVLLRCVEVLNGKYYFKKG